MSKDKPSFLDKVLHPKGEEENQPIADAAKESQEPSEEKPKPAKKSSVKAGASSESKHRHAKFDKFKKGN